VRHEFNINVIDENDSQSTKHDQQKSSTGREIRMDPNDECKTAFDSIRISLGFRANEMNESDRQYKTFDKKSFSMGYCIT
jgi:hypothetical protein